MPISQEITLVASFPYDPLSFSALSCVSNIVTRLWEYVCQSWMKEAKFFNILTTD